MFSNTIQNVVHAMPGWSATGGKKLDIGVVLPDEVTSTRYVEFDAPDLTTAFTDAGLAPAEFNIQNAQGSDATEVTDAQADITNGAKVLLIDPLDSTTGVTIEAAAKRAGVKVIDYDRLTLGGSRQYYVSFNNVQVGTLIGKGMTTCLSTWKVKKPTVFVMYGATTDNNATLFGEGYNAVLKAAGFQPGEGKADTSNTINESTGTWTPSVALTDFEGAYSAHAAIDAVVTPNDENAGADHLLSSGQGTEAAHDSVHRPGCNLDWFPEHPRGLPVRHGVQADLARSAGCSHLGLLPSVGPNAAGGFDKWHDGGYWREAQRQCSFSAADATLGDRQPHPVHGHQGQRDQPSSSLHVPEANGQGATRRPPRPCARRSRR